MNVNYYNQHRPHHSLGKSEETIPIRVAESPHGPEVIGTVKRQERLSGLVSH